MKKTILFLLLITLLGRCGSDKELDPINQSEIDALIDDNIVTDKTISADTASDDTVSDDTTSDNTVSEDTITENESNTNYTPEYDNNDDVEIKDGAITLYKVSGKNITKLVDFNVADELINHQNDTNKHQELWEQAKKIIPESYIAKINEFAVHVGADAKYKLNETLAFVVPTNNEKSKVTRDLSTWRLSLAIDASYEKPSSNSANDGLNTSITTWGFYYL